MNDLEYFIMSIAQSIINQNSCEISTKANGEMKVAIMDFFVAFNGSSYTKTMQNTILFKPGKKEQKTKLIKTNTHLYHIVDILLLSGLFFDDLIDVNITGITDMVDSFRITHWKVFRQIRYDGFKLIIHKRGFAPDGDGLINLKIIPYLKKDEYNKKEHRNTMSRLGVSYRNIKQIKADEVTKIRGLVVSSRIGSDFVSRMTKIIKERCQEQVKNTKVLSILNNKNDSGPSAGYEAFITAETDSGIFYSGRTAQSNDKPEILINEVIDELFEAIDQEVIYDKKLLNRIFFYMANGSGVGQLACKEIDEKCLEAIKEWFGVDYGLKKSGEYRIISIIGKYQ
ncbi:RCL1 [Enterospora canceri]|uniref:RCL1 n=1 Tax=Enterospora canceri TaxID=1081671 RepID=A0A1Y1S6Y4_9MICR|nr:RCL1 [Enterospora canceri]